MEAVLAFIGEDLKNVELQFKKDLLFRCPAHSKGMGICHLQRRQADPADAPDFVRISLRLSW